MRYEYFKDPKLQQQFDEDGIVQVPMLDASEVKLLKDTFHRLHPELPEIMKSGFFSCTCFGTEDYRYEIHNTIGRICDEKLDEILQNYRVLVYTMLTKGVGSKSRLLVHQDWTIVDESKYASLSLWIPLEDATVENGTVHAIRGSHRLMPTFRGGTLLSPFENVSDYAITQMEPFPVKAGHALLFDQSIIHYSPPNQTGNLQIRAISSIVPADAEVQLVYKDPEDPGSPLRFYAAEDKFHLHYDDFLTQKEQEPLSKQVLKEIPGFENPMLNLEEFKTRLNRLPSRRNFFRKLFEKKPSDTWYFSES